MPADDRARQIFQYFKRYNYTVKSTGEVITFAGLYAADRGQAAAVTFYTFVSKFVRGFNHFINDTFIHSTIP